MSKKTDSSPLQNVVVVGGGFAGHNAASALAKTLNKSKFNVILLTARPYFLHLLAGIRMLVSDRNDLLDTALIPYDKLSGVTHNVGRVVAIEERAPGKGGVLVLKDGERIPYAGLVLASGAKWSGFVDFGDTDQEIRSHIATWRKRFAAAKHVVIAGGGAIGIETVGEIKDVYPGTKVTLVHPGKQLLNDIYPDKFRRAVEQRVRQRGAELILSDFLDDIPEPGKTTDIVTREGKTIKAVDLVVKSVGSTPNTEFIASLGTDVLNKAGAVKVKPTLELLNHPGVFAAGDIIAWPEQKQAAKAPAHASVAAANLVSFLNGAPQTKRYKGSMEMIAIPVGKQYGVTYFGVLWGLLVGNWLTSLVKGKSLLVPMSRRALHYK